MLGSVELENKGSVARDHMANERTVLSWIRTAVTLATFSVGFLSFYHMEQRAMGSNTITQDIARLQSMSKFVKGLAVACAGVAVVTLGAGAWRYLSVQHSMMEGNYPVARKMVLLLVGGTGGLLVGLVVMNCLLV